MQFSEHLTRPQLQSGSVIDVMCKLLVCLPVYFSRRQPMMNLSNIPVLLNSGRCWNVLLLNILMFTLHNQWRIQNFPKGHQLQSGEAPIYYLAKFCRKLHENEENWTYLGTSPKFYDVDPPPTTHFGSGMSYFPSWCTVDHLLFSDYYMQERGDSGWLISQFSVAVLHTTV